MRSWDSPGAGIMGYWYSWDSIDIGGVLVLYARHSMAFYGIVISLYFLLRTFLWCSVFHTSPSPPWCPKAAPGPEDLEVSCAGIKTGYDILHISQGRFQDR
ncbi:hypothetical protein K504DRAFT_503596 [Pleomassaria siparia CBS 279.74]|uniref:Uncharacterized protein n=1 Tax=Pleomassaria siparia CBS 279.74 TaxID=1314801 RepID=A0A6G1K7C5_9PLEO|nr:hypothetical protein K504DRAFT_503596 [Pleomassaria siparia CBS 279.74]